MSCLYGEGSVSLIGHGGGGLFYHRGGILHVALVVGGVMTEAGCYDWAYEEMFLGDLFAMVFRWLAISVVC